MNVFTKKLIFLSLILIGIDLLTKLLALNLLPFQNQIRLFGERICFFLTYNINSTGEQAGGFMRTAVNKNLFLLITSINGIILLSYILFIFPNKIDLSLKWAIGTVIFVFILIISELLKKHFANIEISNWIASLISKFAGILFYLTIIRLTRNKSIRFFSVVILSAGIGNLISHFYSPYKVIDFIYIRGIYEVFKIGVFNFADFIFYVGFIGLIITFIIILIKKIFPAHNERAASMRGL